MVIRSKELKELENIYMENGNQLVLMYGAKGCQKEQLLQLFLREKKFFYFRCPNSSVEEQKRELIRQVQDEYAINLSENSYDECFKRIKSGDSSKLVLIIDEFQNIAKKDMEFYESIIRLKEHKLYPGSIMIILCNSSLSWTDREMDEVIGDKVNKIDTKLRLEDVGFIDVVRAFPNYNVSQCIQTYGIIGGVPEYLNRWNGKKSIKENICHNILSPNGYLFNEAENYIASELRELSVYETILSSLARGNEKLNDLFIDTGYSRAKISVYMKNLAAFDVADKVVSFQTGGWDNAKKGIYRIKHNLVNFWFTFVYPNQSKLFTMTPEEFYDKYISDDLQEYLQRYFVEVCQEYLELLSGINKLPIKLTKTGIWLGKQGTIDIVGQDDIRENVVGICNWKDAKMSYESYENLLESMKQARIKAKNIYMFSATEFDEKLVALAETDSKLLLIDMKEL
ncbi:MAG: ATP-binding protein [Lachnospiraceae bacterium]|nr:ATP-binding protein [Lachnospiraceae bacterium]